MIYMKRPRGTRPWLLLLLPLLLASSLAALLDYRDDRICEAARARARSHAEWGGVPETEEISARVAAGESVFDGEEADILRVAGLLGAASLGPIDIRAGKARRDWAELREYFLAAAAVSADSLLVRELRLCKEHQRTLEENLEAWRRLGYPSEG